MMMFLAIFFLNLSKSVFWPFQPTVPGQGPTVGLTQPTTVTKTVPTAGTQAAAAAQATAQGVEKGQYSTLAYEGNIASGHRVSFET